MTHSNENSISPKDSIQILERILAQTLYNLSENKFAFLFWGYLIVLICCLQYILMEIDFKYSFIPWFFTPLGWLITFFYYKRKHENSHVPNPLGKKIAFLWAIAGLNMFAIGFLSWEVLGSGMIGVILIIYSLASFFCGVLIQFKALIWASLIGNVLAIITLMWIPPTYQLLAMAVFVFICSIIPGHLLPKTNS
jgi:hypothetical protein